MVKVDGAEEGETSPESKMFMDTAGQMGEILVRFTLDIERHPGIKAGLKKLSAQSRRILIS